MTGKRSTGGTLNPRRIRVNAGARAAFGLSTPLICREWSTEALESLRERCVDWEQEELDRREAEVMALPLSIEERLWKSHTIAIPKSQLALIKSFQDKLEGEILARVE